LFHICSHFLTLPHLSRTYESVTFSHICSHFHICHTFRQHSIFSINLAPFNLQQLASLQPFQPSKQLSTSLKQKIVLREYSQGDRFLCCTESFLVFISIVSGSFQLNVVTLQYSTRLLCPTYFAVLFYPAASPGRTAGGTNGMLGIVEIKCVVVAITHLPTRQGAGKGKPYFFAAIHYFTSGSRH